MTLVELQQYWWALIALLAALLVLLMFVQGGQSLLSEVGRTETEKRLIVNTLGRKWELTFTTLVTFGGAFFAAFPLFYSTSFGGAYYVWLLILLVFVLQAVSYEFRGKAGNLFGARGYDLFLSINGYLAPLLIGTAVGTFFTGAPFTADPARLASTDMGANIVSVWATPWHGLDALFDARNVALGLAVLFLCRSLGAMYLINSIDNHEVVGRARRSLWLGAGGTVAFLLVFVFTAVGGIFAEPLYLSLFGAGVVLVLWGFYRALFSGAPRSAVWFAGAGTVVAVWALLAYVGYTGSYYPSTVDPASSLTITNSSSSEFTLQTMAWVSLGIPFVVAYIWWAWKAMNKQRLSTDELEQKNEHFY